MFALIVLLEQFMWKGEDRPTILYASTSKHAEENAKQHILEL